MKVSTSRKLQCNDVYGNRTESLYPALDQFWAALLTHMQGFVAFYTQPLSGFKGCERFVELSRPAMKLDWLSL